MYLGFFIFFYIFVYNFYYVNANGNNITQSGVPTENSTNSSCDSTTVIFLSVIFSLYSAIGIFGIFYCKQTSNNPVINENVENIRDLDNIDVRVIDSAETETETETEIVAVEVPLAYAVKIIR